jgi:hypothetical protein
MIANVEPSLTFVTHRHTHQCSRIPLDRMAVLSRADVLYALSSAVAPAAVRLQKPNLKAAISMMLCTSNVI